MNFSSDLVVDHEAINKAIVYLKAGKIIAYPTEAVFGLGCDPFNEMAVHNLLAVKQRTLAKGLIVIASQWQQVKCWVQTLTKNQLIQLNETWPGPTTWVFPASRQVPPWIMGEHKTIAIRITKHPIANALCELFGQPLISTSANLSGQSPAKTTGEVVQYFSDTIDFVVPGAVGDQERPTVIKDIMTGKIIRA